MKNQDQEQPDESFDKLLLELLSVASFIHISQDPEDKFFDVVVFRSDMPGVARQSTIHTSLHWAFYDILHGRKARTHICSKCELEKPLTQFYRYRTGTRDGNTSSRHYPWYCLSCERERIREYERKKRQIT